VSIRAVLFDIYGTLLRSGAGESHPDPELRAAISEAHAVSPYPFPEVDIREIHAGLHPGLSAAESEGLALRHEQAVNPVSPMPGARETLEALAAVGTRLGLVSNAQFYTIPVLESCLGITLAELKIDTRLCRFSYVERRAKPDVWLFESARETLATVGVEAEEVLYVGNDVRNDIDPARATGFRTVLFAGDDTSLRLRGRSLEDSGADHVIHDLREILKLVSPMTVPPS
jgi:putative hydrolase of the HAD superfamily